MADTHIHRSAGSKRGLVACGAAVDLTAFSPPDGVLMPTALLIPCSSETFNLIYPDCGYRVSVHMFLVVFVPTDVETGATAPGCMNTVCNDQRCPNDNHLRCSSVLFVAVFFRMIISLFLVRQQVLDRTGMQMQRS